MNGTYFQMKKTTLALIAGLCLSLSIQAQTIAGKWKLTSIIVESDMMYSIIKPVTLSIDETGKISGNGGCNDYNGNYSFRNPARSFRKPKKIKFSGIIAAKMICQPGSATENAFFSSLRSADAAALEGDELILKSKAVFIKTPQGNVVIQNTMTFTREVQPGQ